MSNEKDNFIRKQMFKQIFAASAQHNKIYLNKDIKKDIKNDFSNFLENYLEKVIKPKYKSSINDESHSKEIEKLSDEVSEKYSSILYKDRHNKGRYRIGTAQKILNLYLKYLWCLNEIEEPPHMPIDKLILGELFKKSDKSKENLILKTNWTELDNIDDYKRIIILARSLIVDRSLSSWEIYTWNEITKK